MWSPGGRDQNSGPVEESGLPTLCQAPEKSAGSDKSEVGDSEDLNMCVPSQVFSYMCDQCIIC